MSTQEARDLLGDFAKDMSDKELEQFIAQCKRFVSLIVNYASKEAS